jgi:NADH-quinone oxidoreductase subunit E
MATQEVNRILKRYGNDPTDIIAILQDVQQTYRYLPKDAMETLAGRLDIPLSRVYHLATFFRAFSLEPRGKHELHVCMGTACHVRGAPRILDALERGLKVKAGETTPDLQYTLETVNCVGACALGPVVVVDGQSKGKLNPQRAERLLKQIEPEAAPKTKKAAAKSSPAKAKKKAAASKKKTKKAPPRKAASAAKKAVKTKTKSTAKKKASSAKAKPSQAKKKTAGKGTAKKRTAKKARR